MARSLFVLLLLAMVITHSNATSWCICKPGSSESVLQKALDYACGAGADCNPIHEKGGCFNPNTVLAHCNYAVNSYFQKKGQAPGSCDFAGAAAVTPSDPSTAGCVYPASASATPTTTTPNTNTPTTTTTTPNGNSPYVTTPNNGGGVVGGGVGTGIGPSGVGINNNDDSHGGLTLQQSACGMVYLLAVSIVFYGLIFLWG